MSFQVIIPASFTVSVIGTPVGDTFAAAVILTLPVPMVNAFPVTETLAAAVTVIVPKPKVNGVAVGVTFALPLIVSDPKPKVKGLPVGCTKAPASAEELPIERVSALPVTLTVTFGLKNDVAIGAPDMEVRPSIYYAPGLVGHITASTCSTVVNPFVKSRKSCLYVLMSSDKV